jgi:hypothetical protein
MFSLADTNPTQITGVLAFTAAACACVLAARRARGRTAAVWKLLAALQIVFVAEIVLGLRHEIHGGVDAFLQDRGWYSQRQPVQLGLLVAAVLLGGAGMVAVLRLSRSHRAAAPGMLASCVVVALFALEMISLHAIDAVLYRLIGPVMLIAVLWVACAAAVAVCSARIR